MEEGSKDNSVVNDVNDMVDSPKPTAFTIDFDEGRPVCKQRHKHLVEKYQKRHKRGASLSKIESVAPNNQISSNKKPQSAQLSRKCSHQDADDNVADNEEKTDQLKSINSNNHSLRDGLSLTLSNITSDRMTQSCTLPETFCSDSFDVSTPELEAVKPPSPVNMRHASNLIPEYDKSLLDIEYDKSDAVSDAGTYTVDDDNYSEEQKAKMSIDKDFDIESVSVYKKAHEYVQSLSLNKNYIEDTRQHESVSALIPPANSAKLSPTQNFSMNGEFDNFNNVDFSKSFSKIVYPGVKSREDGSENSKDRGSVISVTSSGAFRNKNEKAQIRKLSLTKSEVQVDAYTDNIHTAAEIQRPARNLSANLVLVSENLPKSVNQEKHHNNFGEDHLMTGKVVNLPPSVGGSATGKHSPTKIPSPIHLPRSRSRNSPSSLTLESSDSSLDTESLLKPTQNLLNSLQQRLSLDSDHDSENEAKFLNNDARNLLKKATHLRHNSLDERNLKICNKLEHFQNKKFIDQTNVLSQYAQSNKVHKIQNSPNDSPIRRSSSFSTKNQLNSNKHSNFIAKESNLRYSTGFSGNVSLQRSSSIAAVRPNIARRSNVHSATTDRHKFADTESSSEEELPQTAKKKDLTATRYNRAFSLRRARADQEVSAPPKCPNTPEMRRKFQQNTRTERAVSVDRKPAVKGPEVQSRYLQNLARSRVSAKVEPVAQNSVSNKGTAKVGNSVTKPAPKAQVFSRTDSGRFSMRTTKPPTTNSQKTIRSALPGTNKKQQSSPRSNSSLTSKEVEFQNWKRRKSYDPMKAAAEGKRKIELAKKQQSQNPMTQSCHEADQDCDSSPSHSSSVHRSQSFHGTAALELQYLSSEEEEELTLSPEESYSPCTPCDMFPNRGPFPYESRRQ